MTTATSPSQYSVREEIASSVSHGIGAIFGIVALTLLLIKAVSEHADALSIASYSIYGASIILLYLASTLYHAIPFARAKRALKTFDHCAIYLLIAGTYTPFLLITLRTPLAHWVMGLIWPCAARRCAQDCLCLPFQGAVADDYLAMGWLSLVVVYQLAQAMPVGGMVLLGLGGLVYSAGVFFYVKRSIPFNHAIWHLFVLGGTVLHFLAIYCTCSPFRAGN